MPAAAGLVRWKPALELWIDKRTALYRGADAATSAPEAEDEAEEGVSEAAAWGWELEPNLMRRAAETAGGPILAMDWDGEPVLFVPPEGGRRRARRVYAADRLWAEVVGGWDWLITETVRHPTLPLFAHPDGVEFGLRDGAWRPVRVVQAKTTAARWRSDWVADDGAAVLPPAVVLQTAAEMLCVEAASGGPLEGALVPVLIGGQEFLLREIPRDPETLAAVAELVAAFRLSLEQNEPPAAPPTEAGERVLRRMYPAEDPAQELRVVDMTSAAYPLVAELRAARRALEAAEARWTAARVRVEEWLGSAPGLIAPGIKVTWKATAPVRRTDWRRAAERLRALVSAEAWEAAVAAATAESPGARRFVVNISEDEEG